MRVQQLIEKFTNNYEYLDEAGYDEVEYNGEIEQQLFDSMYTNIVLPYFKTYYKDTDIYFNYFYTTNDNGLGLAFSGSEEITIELLSDFDLNAETVELFKERVK